ncbi:hypothetical protein BS50DRAFT_452910, partial [Corynespora cassiicola Philippines]
PKEWQKKNQDIIPISWYEQDLDKGTPERLINRIDTKEGIMRHKETHAMLEEDAKNPKFDNSELKRRLIDDLMLNPSFVDLADELKAMKSEVMTKGERKEMMEKIRKEAEPELQEFNSRMAMDIHESIQELIDDPELEDAREELLDVQAAMPESPDKDTSEFEAALEAAQKKLAGNEYFQKKMAAMEGTKLQAPNDTEDTDLELDAPEDLDKLLLQMKELMVSMGGDKQIEADLDAVINEDPFAEDGQNVGRELDFSELADEIKRLAENSAPNAEAAAKNERSAVEATEEEEDPELKAKVDKIMDDPKLLEKLMYIQKIITESQQSEGLANIRHEVAPDPYELESSKTTSLGHRLQVALNDPEHIAALRSLRVNLLPPFNIAPALKSFNQAIEFAYIGANDDIRRILWRSYVKARTLPTFLQNLSDDAWDLIYYSQAVTWGSNQNRQSHLSMLLADLKSVGRDGPPTHPSTLV